VLIEPVSADMGWSHAALGAIFGGVLLVNGAAGVVAGRLLDRIGSRPLFLAAAVFGAGAMVGASFQPGFAGFALAYTLGCGLVGAVGFYHVTQSIAARGSPADPAWAAPPARSWPRRYSAYGYLHAEVA
jgi:MFS family permease